MNLILIGMPGSGKSSIGRSLAKQLNMNFIDTDKLIEKEHGDLKKLINEKGEDFFSRIEEEIIIKQLENVDNVVISTGGSVVLKPSIMDFLKQLGKIIFLNVSLDEIDYRLKYLRKSYGEIIGISKGIEWVYNYRIPFYKQYADIEINAEERNNKKNAERIIGILGLNRQGKRNKQTEQ